VPRTAQTSFSAGEISPALYGRVDLARYAQGLALCKNFFPTVYGSVQNRPGTRYVAHTKGDKRARLIPFQRSSQETVVLEFTDHALRWHSYGAPVLVEPTDATVQNPTFASVATWPDYSTGGASRLGAGAVVPVPAATGSPIGNMTANGGLAAAFDEERDKPSSRAAARLASAAATIGKSWGGAGPKKIGRVVVNPTPDQGFKSGGSPFFTLRIEGSTDNFAASTVQLYSATLQDDQGDLDISEGLIATTAYAYHRVRFSSADATKNTYASQIELHEITSGGGSLQLIGAVGGVAATEQPIATTRLGQEHILAVTVLGTPGQSVVVMIGGTTNTSGILPQTTLLPGRHLIPFTPGVSPFYVRFYNANAYTVSLGEVRLLGSGASARVPLELATDYPEGELRALYYAESVDVMTVVHPAHPPAELRRLGVRAWSLVDTVYEPVQQPPTGLVVGRTGTGSTDYDYVVTAIAANGEESLPCDSGGIANAAALGAPTNTNNLSWTAAAGAAQYSVYKYRNGIYGLIGSTTELAFKDDGINANVANTPPAARDPFDAAGHYPAAVGFYEGREIYGGSIDAPDTLEMSKAASYRNFSKAVPTQSDDAITATLSSEELNQIVAFALLGSLLVFTTGAYWRVDRGQNGLTPQLDGGVKMQAALGAAPIRPIVVGHAALFVTDKAQGVRSVTYDFASDTYQGDELSTTSKHLLTGRQVLEWSFQRTPWPMLWIVRDDGVMLSLSYLPEQQVTGWARHDTRGKFESVACVSEGTEHAVYVAVRRLVGGTWRRFVERFAARDVSDIRDAYHVDCGLSVDLQSAITAVTLANPLSVTAPGHGCAVGDLAGIDALTGDPYPGLARDGTRLPDLAATANGRLFLVAAVAGDVLTLADRYDIGAAIDASAWPAWLGGGLVRRAAATVAGLDHLEGRTVAILADGSTQEPRAVVGGSVTLDAPAARVHVGLPYVSDLQTLALAAPPDQYGAKKTVTEVLIQVSGSRGLLVGPRFGDLVEQPQRDQEEWNEPTRPLTGHIRITTPSTWSDGAQLAIRQAEPLPLEVLSIVPEIGVGA
jgi:hypothetical protein